MTDKEIDFSDLESKFQTTLETGLERFVVVDGAPIAPAAKVEALTKVLKKVFLKAGPLKEPEGFHMPVDADGKTQGFVFLEFESGEGARNAIKLYNTKKLDAKHTLLVDRLDNIERYTSGHGKEATGAGGAGAEKFKPLPHFRSFLTDKDGRDQAVMHVGDQTGVYWIRQGSNPEPVMQRQRFTEAYVRWSPKGSFLLSLHVQGAALHAGPNFDTIGRFPHRDIVFVDMSPDERYLVTGSRTPIPAPPEDPKQRATWPFKETDEGNNIVIWDTQTFMAQRTFPLSVRDTEGPKDEPPARVGKSAILAQLAIAERERQIWPAFKWSADSKFFARISAPDTLSIYETPSMALVDKKPVKITGIEEFEFAPATSRGRQLLAYWTPEMQNQTARMCIMDVPSKEIIRNRAVVNVANCKLWWQDNAEYLALKIDRLNKYKKLASSSLELYSLVDKAIPVVVVDLKEVVTNFAWEPKSDRFVCTSYLDVSGQPVSQARYILSFYAPERAKGAQGTWKEAYRFENRATNMLLWSPKGRFLATGLTKSTSGQPKIEFWDADHEGAKLPNAGVGAATGQEVVTEKNKDLPINLALLNKVEDDNSFGMTDAAWDSSGRVLATWSSIVRNGGQFGYRLWDLTGSVLRKETIDKFKAFLWRPRPASILPKDKKKEINKNLKQLSAVFDAEDAMRATEETAEQQRKRDDALNSWLAWRGTMVAELEKINIVPTVPSVRIVDGKVVVYEDEIIEQEEEIVE